jgi:hypothetical protein
MSPADAGGGYQVQAGVLTPSHYNRILTKKNCIRINVWVRERFLNAVEAGFVAVGQQT